MVKVLKYRALMNSATVHCDLDDLFFHMLHHSDINMIVHFFCIIMFSTDDDFLHHHFNPMIKREEKLSVVSLYLEH